MRARSVICGVAASVLLFGFIYLLGSFGSAEFNISKWDEFYRGSFAYLGGVLSIVAGVRTMIYVEDQA